MGVETQRVVNVGGFTEGQRRLLADEHWPADVLGGRHVRAAIAATHAAASIHAGGYADLDLRATSMTRTVLR
jgi:hypothetical protein